MNVTLYGKRDFTDLIELRILRWGDYPGFSRWALNVNTRLLIRGVQECQMGDGDGTIETEGEKAMWCRDPNQGFRQPLEKARNGFSATVPRMNQPCQHSTDSFKTSDLQNYKRIKVTDSSQIITVRLNNFSTLWWHKSDTNSIETVLCILNFDLFPASDMQYDTVSWS